MNKTIATLYCVAILALFSGIYMGCDNGSSSSGDHLELGYNIDGGKGSIVTSGSVVVTHGLGVTPTSVIITDSLASSGSGNYYTVTSIGATTFKVNGYDVKMAANGVTALSGSFSWIAIE